MSESRNLLYYHKDTYFQKASLSPLHSTYRYLVIYQGVSHTHQQKWKYTQLRICSILFHFHERWHTIQGFPRRQYTLWTLKQV